MITTSDILHISYTPDLTEGGIAYACRWLACAFNQAGVSRLHAGTGINVERLRHSVAGAAVELAFRHYLGEHSIPFKVLGASPFTDPDHYDVSLGGHRCELVSYHISRRSQITAILRDPALVLQAPALVPLDQFSADCHRPDDIYLFAFLLGLVAVSQDDLHKASLADQPTCLIHPLPDEWSRPRDWLPLERLVLKSECDKSITVEIGGQDAAREFVTVTLELPSKERVLVKQRFHNLAYVRTMCTPEARIGLHSPTRGDPYIIPARAWGNIQVYGMDILLTGWLTHEEYRRRAKALNAGLHTFQYERTRVKNLLVPIHELNPLGPLLAHVKEWEATRKPVVERSPVR
jgi:hypothetical protein